MTDVYIDGYLKKNLDVAKEVIKKDWDMVFAVDGMEGSGKSVLAMQCAYYCDPTLEVDRIVFTAEEFKEAIKKAQPYQAVIFDEAFRGLTGKQTMSRINQSLVKMIAEIRQKNLFVFVVMPTFFDLEKYVALWRSRALLHVYTGENFTRGRFAFFNADRKKMLYVHGKKFYSYSKAKPNFIGRFTNKYPVDEEAYREKKHKALVSDEEDGLLIDELRLKKWVVAKYLEMEDTKLKEKIQENALASMINIHPNTFCRWKKDLPKSEYLLKFDTPHQLTINSNNLPGGEEI